MNTTGLETTAKILVSRGRGILAADESMGSANKRFASVGVEETVENRRTYREILFTTPNVADALSGVIFHDETYWQNTEDGKPFRELLADQGIMPGIKLDEGLVDLAGFDGEKISKGLDGLTDRMAGYRDTGAKFAKWRSVITIGATPNGEKLPTEECIAANAFVLARYARICQDFDIVPIVEPEVLFDGAHSIDDCEKALGHTLVALFDAMKAYRVHLAGAILKTSMVLPGRESGVPINSDEVSLRTTRALHAFVPEELGGVVFLSGGQKPLDAFKNLDAIAKRGPHPWGVTFSYSRALQDPVLKYWANHRTDADGAKHIFAEQLKIAVDAREGKLAPDITDDNFVSQGQDL